MPFNKSHPVFATALLVTVLIVSTSSVSRAAENDLRIATFAAAVSGALNPTLTMFPALSARFPAIPVAR